jgi:hypothetical protein
VAADWGGVHIQSQELMLRTSFGLAAQLLAAPGSSAALGYPFMILTCSCLAPELCGPGVTQRGRVTRVATVDDFGRHQSQRAVHRGD